MVLADRLCTVCWCFRVVDTAFLLQRLFSGWLFIFLGFFNMFVSCVSFFLRLYFLLTRLRFFCLCLRRFLVGCTSECVSEFALAFRLRRAVQTCIHILCKITNMAEWNARQVYNPSEVDRMSPARASAFCRTLQRFSVILSQLIEWQSVLHVRLIPAE